MCDVESVLLQGQVDVCGGEHWRRCDCRRDCGIALPAAARDEQDEDHRAHHGSRRCYARAAHRGPP
jgi:hypothetical protein